MMAAIAVCAALMVLVPLASLLAHESLTRSLGGNLAALEGIVDTDSLHATTQLELAHADDTPASERTPAITTCPEGWAMQSGGTCSPPPPPEPKVTGPGFVVECQHGTCTQTTKGR